LGEGADDGRGHDAPHGVTPGALTALLRALVAPEAQREGGWESLQPGAVLGRFELLRELGRGGFGVVWEARDQELGRKVAFKVIRAGRPEADADKLHREAEVIARLQHPNLVTLYDAGRCEHGPYLVLELLRGETLQARLLRKRLSVGEALAVGLEVARGLAYAHAEGVIHRDLKPSNVFLCHRGGVKLLDFGMAHAFGHKRTDGGTPGYMAPEQWSGAPEDERTDVFALGVMLFKMLAGALPFPDAGGKVAQEAAPAPELQVPGFPGLGPLVGRMLTRDPAARTRDGGVALAALESIAAEPPGDAASTGGPVVVRSPQRRGSRHGRLFAGMVAAATLALGGTEALRSLRRAPAPGRPSIAVLPFADMSPQKDQEYLSDGVAEEIRNALAKLEGLRVPGRTSSFSFRGDTAQISEIGRQLNVGAVLEGSVRKDGNRVRISAQLVSTTDGFRLWSETYDRELNGVFAVEDEIAQAVANSLKVKLLPGQEPSTGAYRTSNPEVYNQYLIGHRFFARESQDGMRRAVEAFARAVTLEPDYAPAQAGLALALVLDGTFNWTSAGWEDLGQRAMTAANRAVTLAPDLAEARAARGKARSWVAWDWAGARVDLERAVRLSPGDALVEQQYAALLASLGRLPDAIRAQRRATELDPLRGNAWQLLGYWYSLDGQFGLAREALDRARALNPDSDVAWVRHFEALLWDDRPAAALALVESEHRRCQSCVAMAQHDLGHAAESQRALDGLIARAGDTAPYTIASVYAWRGENDAAFEWLARAVALHHPDLVFTKVDVALRNLRTDPRFGALLTELNLPQR
jgi:eukaryotic-like serine/threonine-protein kinase